MECAVIGQAQRSAEVYGRIYSETFTGEGRVAGLALRLCWKAFPAPTGLREWRDDLYRAL